MAFKMSGFNPGKGTGMSAAFAKKQAALKQTEVTLNPNTRDDPNWRGGFDAGEGISGAPREIEIDYSNRNFSKDELGKDIYTQEDRANKEMFDDLKTRLGEYQDDPYSVEVGPQEAWMPRIESKDGKMVAATSGGLEEEYKNWLNNNAKQLKEDNILHANWKPGGLPPDPKVKNLYNKKIEEAVNIDNDLKMSAAEGYGFTPEQLQNYGIFGMEQFGGNPNEFDGGELAVTTSLDDYAPNPVLAGNIAKNEQNIDIAQDAKKTKIYKEEIMKSIQKGGDISMLKVHHLAKSGNDPNFVHEVVEVYEQFMGKGTRKTKRDTNKFYNMLGDRNLTADKFKQFTSDIGIGQSAEGKDIIYENPDTGIVSIGTIRGQVEGYKPRYAGEKADWDLDLSEESEYVDDTTRMMDEDIKSQKTKEEGEGVAIGGDLGDGENELEEIKTKQDTDDETVVDPASMDRWQLKTHNAKLNPGSARYDPDYAAQFEQGQEEEKKVVPPVGSGPYLPEGKVYENWKKRANLDETPVEEETEGKLEGDLNEDGVVDWKDDKIADQRRRSGAMSKNIDYSGENPFKRGTDDHFAWNKGKRSKVLGLGSSVFNMYKNY